MSKTRPADVPLPAADEENLTRLEACRLARISLSKFDRAAVAKLIHVQRNGRTVTVKRGEMDRYIASDA